MVEMEQNGGGGKGGTPKHVFDFNDDDLSLYPTQMPSSLPALGNFPTNPLSLSLSLSSSSLRSASGGTHDA